MLPKNLAGESSAILETVRGYKEGAEVDHWTRIEWEPKLLLSATN